MHVIAYLAMTLLGCTILEKNNQLNTAFLKTDKGFVEPGQNLS